jgi:transcription-repair coupling factor (superfamily II helicase)
LKDRTQFADEGEDFAGWEFLFPLVNPLGASLFDFLENYVLVVEEPALIEQTLSTFYETLDTRFAETAEAGEIGLEPHELFLSGEELRGKFEAKQRVELRALGRTAAQTDEQFSLDAESPTGKLRFTDKEIREKAAVSFFDCRKERRN